MSNDKNPASNFVIKSRKQGVKVVANELKLTLVVPITDLVGVVIEDDIGAPTRHRTGRRDRKDAAVSRSREIVGTGVPFFYSCRKRSLVPCALHQLANPRA